MTTPFYERVMCVGESMNQGVNSKNILLILPLDDVADSEPTTDHPSPGQHALTAGFHCLALAEWSGNAPKFP